MKHPRMTIHCLNHIHCYSYNHRNSRFAPNIELIFSRKSKRWGRGGGAISRSHEAHAFNVEQMALVLKMLKYLPSRNVNPMYPVLQGPSYIIHQ